MRNALIVLSIITFILSVTILIAVLTAPPSKSQEEIKYQKLWQASHVKDNKVNIVISGLSSNVKSGKIFLELDYRMYLLKEYKDLDARIVDQTLLFDVTEYFREWVNPPKMGRLRFIYNDYDKDYMAYNSLDFYIVEGNK